MTIDLTTSSDSHGDTFAAFEDVLGTFFNDSITGDDGSNEIFGIDGNDQLFGLGGDDLLVGDEGTDSADGGLGTDQCDAETEAACEADPTAATSTPLAFHDVTPFKAAVALVGRFPPIRL
jgi:RTX calcium-binding nonapeptide repeat (4 copies)